MKRTLIMLVILLCTLQITAQNVISSSVYIQTCINKTNCFSVNNSAYIFYDDTKEELTLKIDFNKFRTGSDTLDHWMEDLSGSMFYFVAHVDRADFVNLDNNTSETVKMVGDIYFNDMTQNITTELVMFQTSDHGMLSQKTNDNTYDTYRVNFGLSFLPKDFKIHKGEHNLKELITIGVAAGRINQLKPEMRELLKDLPKNKN